MPLMPCSCRHNWQIVSAWVLKVEAEGSVSNGVMTADYVEIRGGEVKLMATANGVQDAIAGTFEISILSTAITVELTTATSTEDAKGTGCRRP